MSTLGEQASNLRLTADAITAHGVTSGDIAILQIRLREAADTITSLSDKLQGVMGTRYCELFGTPERAARTLHGPTLTCNGCALRDGCAKTPEDSNCMIEDYDALLEWLRGDAE